MLTNVIKANTSTNVSESRFMQRIVTRNIGKMVTIIKPSLGNPNNTEEVLLEVALENL